MKFTITILLLFPFLSLNAQPFKVLYLPGKYVVPEENVSLSETTEMIRGSYWEVFSDKAYNRTYKTPKLKQAFKTLSFLEKFYVVEEEENYVRIAKGKTGYPIQDINTQGSLIGGEDYGWISKENLLLWKNSLRTKDKILKKAILLNSLSALKVREMESKIQFYSTPKLNTSLPNSQNLFDFFYVFKETNEAVLLGDKDRLSFNQSDAFGWVAKNKITPWNHRIAVEPELNTTINIYDTKRKAIENSAKPIMVIQVGNERKIGTWRRFPVLDKDTVKKVLKIAVVGSIYKNHDESVNEFEPEILNFLVQRGFDTSDVHNILEDNRQFYTEAYVKYQEEGIPTLINSLLFTREELGTLIHYFNLIESAAVNLNRRKVLKTAWIKILKDYLGDKYSVEEILEKYLDEVHKIIIGLPTNKSAFFHIKIKDITNSSMISDRNIEKYIDLITISKFNLRAIYNNSNYKYGFYSDTTPYYWILSEDLP